MIVFTLILGNCANCNTAIIKQIPCRKTISIKSQKTYMKIENKCRML